MRIDAHQHYWQLGRSDYAWMQAPHAVIRRDFLPSDLAPLLKATGIDGTVLVQADATARETDFMLEIAAVTANVLGVVGWVDFTAKDAVAQVEYRAGQDKLRGLRPMLEFIADPEWILQPAFKPVLRTMVQQGLSFDALVHPQHLPAIETLVRRHPDLPMVIDHGAKPKLRAWRGNALALVAWRDDMRKLARHQQVYCKLSGLLTEAGAGWQDGDLLPAMQILLDLFGPSRLIWGSDWPVMTLAGQYSDWIELSEQALIGLTHSEKQQIYSDNAADFYKLDISRSACKHS
ncbi:amidohydrolase [Ferrovibrio sp.]|uniref:amidohydrolase family protein n=1 Tax=Ferrovibrio sp. TaxID=1917215 RepID=UPI000CABE825|nr:amidohydrolase family protein [Ferrovibrio sp.]PJI40951.1 MAG: amidohydrolase [Ferrovibrio sp.]